MAPELALPDGAVVVLDAPVVVGREPVAPPDLPGAIAVAITDDMSVSKTHALIEWSGGSLWVTDLNSSNGTDIVAGDGNETRLTPGIPAVVASGATIRVGSSSDLTFRPAVAPPPALAASWHEDASITAARRSPISPPPGDVSSVPVISVPPSVAPPPQSAVTLPPQPVASMTPFGDQEHLPEPVAGPQDVATFKLEQLRRVGAWILAAWGGLTALLTLTRESFASPSLPSVSSGIHVGSWSGSISPS